MVISIIFGIIALSILPFWIRASYRLLKDATTTEEAVSPYKRSLERVPVRERGSLNWALPEGGTATMAMMARNMSRYGALVETERALPVGSVVLIHFASQRTMTTATVRHCNLWGSSRFRIGLEFRHPLMVADGGTWEIVMEPVL